MKIKRISVRKPTWSALLPIALGAAFVVSAAVSGRSESGNPSQHSQAAPTAGPTSAIAARVESLSEKWMQQVGVEGWLFFTYKDEITGPVGNNSETGWPIANQAQWELWYELDQSGQAVTVLVRHTDLERGNVTRVAWRDGTIFRDPIGTIEGGHAWGDYHPIKDHFCSTSLLDLAPSAEVNESWSSDNDGLLHWITVLHDANSPISTSDISGEMQEYVATELTCGRNAATGAVEFSNLTFIPSFGEPIVYQTTYDYSVTQVAEPPFEMLQLLEQLSARLSDS